MPTASFFSNRIFQLFRVARQGRRLASSRQWLRWIFVLFALMSATSPAAQGNIDLERSLRNNYMAFAAGQPGQDNPLPFILSSATSSTYSSASVKYFLDGVPLALLADRLSRPSQWCEFIPLHLNIKACTHFERADQAYLRFYVGIKGYLTPDDAHMLQLKFDSSMDDDVFVASLFAADGPLDSADISFNVRAIGVDDDGHSGTYLEFDLSSVPGVAASLAKVYLATIARNKIGFSIDGTTWSGKARYVRGQRAAAERNLVRYLLAIETYFSTLRLDSSPAQYSTRLETWFDATEQYSAQLFELNRSEYLANKRRERENQERLQAALGQGPEPEFNVRDERR